MEIALSEFYCACALGAGNGEVWRNLRRGEAGGMKEIGGDIPGRKIWFGAVETPLPPVEKPFLDIRTNALVELAISGMPYLGELKKKYPLDRIGVVLGASTAGMDEAQRQVDEWLEKGAAPDAFDPSMIELGTPALYLKARLGVAGPAYTVSTACSSSTKTFAAARRLISSGLCDAVVTGGVDSRCRFAMNGFHALGALSEGRCRPLAEDRDGINLGEGVAIFAVERAELSPGKVVVKGVGESSDAYHATAPDPEGRGAEAAMRLALADAGMQPGDVDYVNLHGTGTFANDAMELKAVERVFGSVRYESTKNLTGHCLGAAGAVEAAICALRIENGDVRAALSNSFAFGGSNASVVLGVRG
jgi:3-oxoacyl-[acyl-carrier-protein] synthase-1